MGDTRVKVTRMEGEKKLSIICIKVVVVMYFYTDHMRVRPGLELSGLGGGLNPSSCLQTPVFE